MQINVKEHLVARKDMDENEHEGAHVHLHPYPFLLQTVPSLLFALKCNVG
jgi:hypothetical protein